VGTPPSCTGRERSERELSPCLEHQEVGGSLNPRKRRKKKKPSKRRPEEKDEGTPKPTRGELVKRPTCAISQSRDLSTFLGGGKVRGSRDRGATGRTSLLQRTKDRRAKRAGTAREKKSWGAPETSRKSPVLDKSERRNVFTENSEMRKREVDLC